MHPSFIEYQQNVIDNAAIMAHTFICMGYDIVSGGTDNHLFVINLSKTHPTLSGRQVEKALEEKGILVNRNMIPGDPKSPLQTSGIRIGTPAMTTRNWTAQDFISCAQTIHSIITELAQASRPAEQGAAK